MTPTPRVSAGTEALIEEGRWTRVVRWIAIAVVLFGFFLVCWELYDNITCPTITLDNGNIVRAGYCGKLHLAHMLWGGTFIVFGLITIRFGDPSKSLTQVVASGTVVREWLRRGRASDKPGTVVAGAVIEPEPDPKNHQGEQ